MQAAGHRVNGTATWFASSGSFLKEAVFYSDGRHYSLNPSTLQISARETYPAPYDQGFVQGYYRVLEQGFEGTIPKRVVLQCFKPTEGGSSTNDLWLAYEYGATLTQLGKGGPNLREVTVKPRAHITDFRSLLLKPPVAFVQYVAETNEIPQIVPGPAQPTLPQRCRR